MTNQPTTQQAINYDAGMHHFDAYLHAAAEALRANASQHDPGLFLLANVQPRSIEEGFLLGVAYGLEMQDFYQERDKGHTATK